MKTKILFIMMALVLAVASASAQKFRPNLQRVTIDSQVLNYPVASQSRMYVEDFDIAVGETKQVMVYMDNELPLWFLQLQMTLPEGLSVTGAEFSDEFIALTNYTDDDGVHNDNTMTYSWQGEVPQELRLLTVNMPHEHAIPVGEHQSVFVITVRASETMATGQFEAQTTLFRMVAATTQEGEGYDGANTTCSINVVPARATDVQVTPNQLDLKLGQQATLRAAVMPSYVTQVVSWTSSDASVATVDSEGHVTACGVGQATITATTTEAAQLTATCQVSVSPVLITELGLNQTAAIVKPGTQIDLEPIIEPSNATYTTLNWTTSNDKVATVDQQGHITVVARGTAVITAATTDGTELGASCLVAVDNQPDVDGDGHYDVVDVNNCINVMLGRMSDPELIESADVDGSGDVDVTDVNLVINAILYGQRPTLHEVTVNGVSFTMVPVQGDEQIASFAIAQTEVTQELYKAVMGQYCLAAGETANPTWPVEHLYHSEALAFVKKLNQLTGMNFRIPWTSEWSYAAKGGVRSRGYQYAGSDVADDVAWYKDNSDNHPHPVATKNANELGLYDMSGNVNEWGAEVMDRWETTVEMYSSGSYSEAPWLTSKSEWYFEDYHNYGYVISGHGLRLSM